MRGFAAKVALALVVIILLGVLFLLVREFYALYAIAKPELRLGVLTAVGSGAALIWTSSLQAKRERQSRLFESKRAAYSHFFDLLFSMLRAQKLDSEVDQDKLMQDFSAFTQNVMTWGSAETINAFNSWQRGNLSHSDDVKTIFRNIEVLLRALRKDLGHNDTALESFALSKLILKVEEHHKLN